MRTAAVLFAAFLATLPPGAWALDRGHFAGLMEEDLDPVARAFDKTMLHYLLTGNGDSIVTVMKTRDPKITGIPQAAIFFYFNPRDAQAARARYEKTYGVPTVVKSSPAAKIIRQQFARRASGFSSDPNRPDFVAFLSDERKIDTIEYLVRKDGSPITTDIAGKPTAVAFLSRARAIEVQSKLRERGTECDRVGLDEKAFLRYVADSERRGVAFQVYGY